MKDVRLLRADEIEVKIGKKNSRGFSVVLYKNARVDRTILDETYGAYNWKNDFAEIGGELYCTVEIYDEDKKEWIKKVDAGSTTSRTEKAKSLASDAFKRACFKLGIGTELYNTHSIFVECEMEERGVNGDNPYYEVPYKNIRVEDIEFNEDERLTKIIIVAGKEVIYSYEKEKPKMSADEVTKKKQKITAEIIAAGKEGNKEVPLITVDTKLEELEEMLKKIQGRKNDK